MIPIRTNIWPRRTPYANYCIILLNVLVYMLQWKVDPFRNQLTYADWVDSFILVPGRLSPIALISYAFLHANLTHILGNMFFLYIFGNNVNDKLGNTKYCCFYVLGAVASGLGHILLNPNPVLGASGAVAAVTGAYLVLFPKTLITVLYFFFLIGTWEMPALWFILIKMILIDNYISRIDGVAYDAHLAGYAFGIGGMLLFLALGWLERSQYDLLAMLHRWNQRRQFRDMVSDGSDPFSGLSKRRNVRVKVVEKTPEQMEKDKEIQALRREISTRLLQKNLASAAEAYLQLMAVDPQQVLTRQALLDIANHLAGASRSTEAARAYEQYLEHYGRHEHVEQVMLMLGLLYARYLDQSDQAVEYLGKAVKLLRDPGQIQMCRQELERLGKNN
jgi:membrane associated rhomboid family serine protease